MLVIVNDRHATDPPVRFKAFINYILIILSIRFLPIIYITTLSFHFRSDLKQGLIN